MENRTGFWYLSRAGGRKTLASHQKHILRRMEESGSLGIFAEAGTGKTMIALTYIHAHLLDGQIDNALVVCPASLIDSWRLAIDRMSEFGYSDFDIELVKECTCIISYNRIWKKNPDFGRRRGPKYIIRPEINHPWGAMFFDESHRLGDPSSIQTTISMRMAGHSGRKDTTYPCLSDHRFVMTGTPDSTRYIKLYGQLSVIDPDLFRTRAEFENRYVLLKDYFDNPIKYDVEALEDLKRRYGTVARLRECFDMPLSTETDIPIHLTPEQRTAYMDMLRLRGRDYNISFNTAGIGSMKAMQVCCGFYYDDDKVPHYLKNDKLDALRTIIEGRDDKVVIFCQFTPTVDLLMKELARYNPIRFDGSVKDPVWGDFQNDPGRRLIIVQYQRGSEGIDLFSACCMVFYEPTPSPYILEQAHARIMRKGQERNCTYYFIYSLDTIEARSLSSVREGMEVSRQRLDEQFREEQARYGIEPISEPV